MITRLRKGRNRLLSPLLTVTESVELPSILSAVFRVSIFFFCFSQLYQRTIKGINTVRTHCAECAGVLCSAKTAVARLHAGILRARTRSVRAATTIFMYIHTSPVLSRWMGRNHLPRFQGDGSWRFGPDGVRINRASAPDWGSDLDNRVRIGPLSPAFCWETR